MKKLLPLLVLLALPTTAKAACSFAQTPVIPAPTSATSRTFVYGSNNASGNLLLLWLEWASGPSRAVSSISDTPTNTWTQIGVQQNVPTNDFGTSLYQVDSSAAGANTVTVNVTGSAGTIEGILLEIHCDGTRTFDTFGNRTDNGLDMTISTAAVTAALANSMFLGFIGLGAQANGTADSGWTIVQNGNNRCKLLYNFSVTAGSNTATGTLDANARESTRAAIWSEAGSGGFGKQVGEFLVGP